jgi:hypothetical protein
MATDPQRIVVPATTRVWLADVGETAPTDADTPMSGNWVDVGLTTQDSLAFETSPEFVDVNSAQSDFPTRTFQSKESATIQVDLQEWSAFNFQAAYGGGEVTEPSSGVFKFEPPLLGARDEKACVIEVIDGDKNYRYIIPRVLQKEGVQQPLNKGSEAKLPLKFTILGGDVSAPWYLLSNDPSFDPSPS